MKYEKKARGFYFQDSTFTTNRKFVVELMKLMIKEDLGLSWVCNTRADCVNSELLELMYKAGCRQISLGIESGNQESLDLVNKKTTVEKQTRGVELIKKAGMRYINNFIIGLPGEDEDMVRNTIHYAKKLGAYIALFWIPVPYPGTALFEICKKEGSLRATSKWADYLAFNYNNPVYINPKLGLSKMRYWYIRANIEYYSSPHVWLANLNALRTMDDIKKLFRGFRILLEIIIERITKIFGDKVTSRIGEK